MKRELQRLAADADRSQNWKRWGPYLTERQWGTVREDYSPDGSAWTYFPHDHARSRAYRWGEDGLLGFTDRQCRLCFAVALWNGADPILKERLFGLANEEGNHGEDVKEHYAYLDATPTFSYAKALYRYPQQAYPYAALVAENRRRDRFQLEYELADTGVLDDRRYFDVVAEYAKAGPDDLLIRLTIHNRADQPAPLHILPTLWFRNTWSWGCRHEGCTLKPQLWSAGPQAIYTTHETLGDFTLSFAPDSDGTPPPQLFTENETNTMRLFGVPSYTPYVKDAFHEAVINKRADAVNPRLRGTKAALLYHTTIAAGGSVTIRLRLSAGHAPQTVGAAAFDAIFARRKKEADAFYAAKIAATLSRDEQEVSRHAYAGLLWTRQFYHLVVDDWLRGDPDTPPPPAGRDAVRNGDWRHLYSRDILSVPDKWEYPWFAAWDLAFHMLPMARIDPDFAKQQLLLLLREWYQHPNGAMPAYEYAFDDVNPPVHAWACWRVYKISAAAGARDTRFLAAAFQKLLVNFTWWVNRKDAEGNHLFGGGFLGLDNIGLFDRSKPLPGTAELKQADATAWMAFYAVTMLAMAIELAQEDIVYEDMASKFFEHFIAIADAMNHLGQSGLWHEEDGFYYDQLVDNGQAMPLRVRSLVGLIPLLAVEALHVETLERLPGFRKRLDWFLEYRHDLSRQISLLSDDCAGDTATRRHLLLAIPSRDRLLRLLSRLFDENEFLSPYGLRSLSKAHSVASGTEGLDPAFAQPVTYTPGESDTFLFGGNSNWRGPIWFPTNYLLIEAIERYHHFYGDTLRLEYPTGSGQTHTLAEIATDLHGRLAALFRRDADGRRPCDGDAPQFAADPHWRHAITFPEYFHGDSGRGLGAMHQTGWTALVASSLAHLARKRHTKK